MKKTYGEKLGDHEPSSSGDEWFTKKFAEAAGEQLKGDEGAWMKYGPIVRRLLRLAAELSVARVELKKDGSKTTALTGEDMWVGLYAVQWAACPDVGFTGRWCNFLEDGPPDGKPKKPKKAKKSNKEKGNKRNKKA